MTKAQAPMVAVEDMRKRLDRALQLAQQETGSPLVLELAAMLVNAQRNLHQVTGALAEAREYLDACTPACRDGEAG